TSFSRDWSSDVCSSDLSRTGASNVEEGETPLLFGALRPVDLESQDGRTALALLEEVVPDINARLGLPPSTAPRPEHCSIQVRPKIGRASCRESVKIAVA